MPVMNGYDTLIELKKTIPEILVLVLTMIDHQGNFLRMIHAGADGYMLKEEDPEELVRAIRFMMQHGFYNSPTASRRRL